MASKQILDPILKQKFQQAAQAIKDSHALLICSGSGMTADSNLFYNPKHQKNIKQIILQKSNGFTYIPQKSDQNNQISNIFGNSFQIPIIRGTYGLWHHFPIMKKYRIPFNEFKKAQFFDRQTNLFWYVYGQIYNKYTITEPHQGYHDLHQILKIKGDKNNEQFKNWFIYHQGVDSLYSRAMFDKNNIFQPKGNLMNWQCTNCQRINEDVHLSINNFVFEVNIIDGFVEKIPTCNECNENLRPNIQFKDDLDFLEDNYNKQMQNMDKFIEKNKRRSFVVLEIGASCVQPIARTLAFDKFLEDKYKCTLIRINTFKERQEAYDQEEEAYEIISSQYNQRQRKIEQRDKLLKELKYNLRCKMNISKKETDSDLDKLLQRSDGDETIDRDQNQYDKNYYLGQVNGLRKQIIDLSQKISKMKDEIDMMNGTIPKYFSETEKYEINKKERDDDNQKIYEEEIKIQKSSNQFIDIQMDAKNALRLIKEALQQEQQLKQSKD